MSGRGDAAFWAAEVLRAAGRRVGRRAYSSLWTVGLAVYDRRQLIGAARREMQARGCRPDTVEFLLEEQPA